MFESNSEWTPDVDDSQFTRKLMVLSLDTETDGSDDEELGTERISCGIEKAVRKIAASWRP